MNYSEFKKIKDINKKFLDTIDFEPYIDEYDGNIMKIMDVIKSKFNDSLELPQELNGCVLDCYDKYEFAKYLSKRYSMCINEEVVTNYYLVR